MERSDNPFQAPVDQPADNPDRFMKARAQLRDPLWRWISLGVSPDTILQRLLRRGISPDLAQDAVSDLLAKIAQGQVPVPHVHSLEAYLRRMVRNRAVDRVRAEQRLREYQARKEVPEPIDIPRMVMDSEHRRRLSSIMAQLTPKEAWLLHQRFAGDKSLRDLASVLGESPEHVRRTLGGILERLRRELSKPR